MADRPTDDGLDPRYREVWRAAPPPSGFVDRVLAVTHAEGNVAARKRRSLLGRAAIALAVVAAAAVVLVGARPRAREGEHLATTARLSVSITERATAVLEPRAHLRWRSAGGRVTVEQDGGDVFYRVDRGVAFEVKTAAGSVLVKGTCFKVEVTAMSPTTHTLIGAVSGMAITALAVTVYEGMVEVQNEHGETRLGAGDRGVAEQGEAPRVARPLSAARPSNVPRLSDATLAALREDPRATIAALEQKVASLSSELTEARRQELEGPRDKDGIPKKKFHDFTPEELTILASRCEIRYDIPKFLSSGRIELRGLGDASNGISEAEVAQLNRHLRELAPPNLERLRALYRDGTGDHAGAATLAPKQMIRALFERYPQELDRAKQRLSLERAGLPPPPDPGGPSVVEQLLRLIFAAGDELERRGAQVLGAERTHELRRNGAGYEPGNIQSGCPTAPASTISGQ